MSWQLVARCFRWPDGVDDRDNPRTVIPIVGTKMCGSNAALLVLVYMCERANDLNIAYPMTATIARETGLTERTVRRAKTLLEEQGYLAVVGSKSGGGPHHSTRYRIVFPQATTANPDIHDTNEEAVKSNGQVTTPNPDENGGEDTSAPNPDIHAPNPDENGGGTLLTPTNRQVSGGEGALALAADAAAPGAGNEAAAEILDSIISATGAHGISATKVLAEIERQLAAEFTAEQIFVAATSKPSEGVKHWTGTLVARIRETRWNGKKPPEAKPTGDTNREILAQLVTRADEISEGLRPIVKALPRELADDFYMKVDPFALAEERLLWVGTGSEDTLEAAMGTVPAHQLPEAIEDLACLLDVIDMEKNRWLRDHLPPSHPLYPNRKNQP